MYKNFFFVGKKSKFILWVVQIIVRCISFFYARFWRGRWKRWLFLWVVFHLIHMLQNLFIGFHEIAVVEFADIDERGCGVGMPQCFGDDGQFHVAPVCHACPGVAHDIRREIALDARLSGKFFQLFVVAYECLYVLLMALLHGVGGKKREHVFTSFARVFINNVLHTRLQLHPDNLSRLMPTVCDDAVANLLFAQMGGIYERHP